MIQKNYKPTDRKQWFFEIKRQEGTLSSLHSFAIGIIGDIVKTDWYSPEEKLAEIITTLSDMDKVWCDDSDAKKTSTAMEAEKKISHVDCIIDTSKVEPFLDRRMAEDVLRGE